MLWVLLLVTGWADLLCACEQKNVLVTRSMFPPGDGAEEETLLKQLPLWYSSCHTHTHTHCQSPTNVVVCPCGGVVFSMRILHHHQDTGGFFVALIEKVKPWVPRGSGECHSTVHSDTRLCCSHTRWFVRCPHTHTHTQRWARACHVPVCAR